MLGVCCVLRVMGSVLCVLFLCVLFVVCYVLCMVRRVLCVQRGIVCSKRGPAVAQAKRTRLVCSVLCACECCVLHL